MKRFDAIAATTTAARKTITLFLTIILLTGTIASFYPSSSSSSLSFTTQVHALSEYGNMINYDNYKSRYSSFERDNAECKNFNLNLNGLDVNAIPEPLGSLLGEDQAHSEDKDIDTITFYDKNGKEKFVGYNDKDFTFVCKNNNNNELTVLPPPPPPPTPPTPLPTVNNVCTVWEDDTPGNFDIFFSVSTNGGLTFSDPENLSEGNTQDSHDPQVICEGNKVYVVWYEYTPDFGTTDVFFARSTDGGLTFSDPENLSEGNTGDSFIPKISSDGENVYVVWQDYTPDFSTSDIFFARSTDGGLNFSDPENLSEENTGFSVIPQISSDGENVYVVWYDDTPGNFDVFFARSTDGGLTFSDPENLSEGNTGDSSDPQISSEGNNVYVVWYGNSDIFFARSTDGGLNFSDPENISEGNTGDSSIPQISSDGENLYVVWYGNFDIFFARSTDGGLNFSDPENLSEENTGISEFQEFPQISSDGENVYVVWHEYTPDSSTSDIFFARSTDGGLTFSDPENLSEENTGFSELPQISSDGENVYVVWHDDTPGNFDIFFARSTDGGLTFSDPENLSEGNTGDAFDPQISSSSSSSSSSRSGFLSSMNNSHQQLSTNDISHAKNTTIIKSLIQEKLQQKQIVEQQNIQTNKIKTSSLPTGPLIYDIPKH